jgi:hypothetical protein
MCSIILKIDYHMFMESLHRYETSPPPLPNLFERYTSHFQLYRNGFILNGSKIYNKYLDGCILLHFYNWINLCESLHPLRFNKQLHCIRRILVEKRDGKRPLSRPCRRWENNNRMDLQKAGCGVMTWIHLAQDMDRWRTLVYAVMNLRGSMQCGEFLD